MQGKALSGRGQDLIHPKTSSYNAISVPPILRPGAPGYDCDSHKPARSADVDK
jgi:hypothetical protein